MKPKNDDGLNRANGQTIHKNENDSRDCATAAAAKQLHDLQARAALRGCELHKLADGRYLMCRWGLTRELADAEAVAAMLAQMGGAR